VPHCGRNTDSPAWTSSVSRQPLSSTSRIETLAHEAHDPVQHLVQVLGLHRRAHQRAHHLEQRGAPAQLLVQPCRGDRAGDLVGHGLQQRELAAERAGTHALGVDHAEDLAAVAYRHADLRARAGHRLDVLGVAGDVVDHDRQAGHGNAAADARAELAKVADEHLARQLGRHRLVDDAAVARIDRGVGHEFPAERGAQRVDDALEHRSQLEVLGGETRDRVDDLQLPVVELPRQPCLDDEPSPWTPVRSDL
jgi:hypothetical protein